MVSERFVSADEAAQHLGVRRRFLLSLARQSVPGAYPVDPRKKRKRWIFRLSELCSSIDPKLRYDPSQGSSR